MLYSTLPWKGPFALANFDFSAVPARPGVYVFTEFNSPLKPNPPIPAQDHPNYERSMDEFRIKPCVLYVGKAKTLKSRLSGYRFRPYLEIKRRPKGAPSRHEADKHKGRALLHAQQFFNGPIFLWWAEDPDPESTEATLLRELNPVLNTVGVQLLEKE